MPVSKRTNWKGLDFLSLDTTLTIFLQNDPWFKQHPVALEILKSGNSLISINKSNLHNLQALLGNMCSYGATRWQYEPGQATSADRVLSNLSRVTDCKSLADIFVELVQHLPLTISNLQDRHMTSSMHHDLNAGRRLELPWLRGESPEWRKILASLLLAIGLSLTSWLCIQRGSPDISDPQFSLRIAGQIIEKRR